MTGKTILQYEIQGELGRGGMGVVYRAHDVKLDRPVALKFLPPNINPSEQDVARFTQEAKAAAALNHPNVCTIYDIKEHDRNHFIVMEYVDGVTLRSRIAGEPLPLSDVLVYGLQIADALQEAHGRGIVHRDIKADNIMVNAKGQVKVMDFGLAKLKGTLKLTRSSSTLGTLAYMAPEQIQGGEVDARSDIFSFGVLLFELLTGRMPFRGEHEAAMMYSILNEAPEPLQKYLPDAPPELLHVIGRSLEKDPADRYQTIQEMAIDLRRMRKESSKVSRPVMPAGVRPRQDAPSGQTTLAAVTDVPVAPDVPPPPPPKSHRTTTVTLNVPTLGGGSMLRWLVPALVIVAGVTGYFLFAGGGEDPGSGERIPVAVADFQNQTREDDLNGLSGMLITSLEQSQRLSVMTRSRMFDILKQMGKGDAGRIDESLGREICRRTGTDALVVASVSRFDDLYIIDMKVLDPEKNEYLLTLKEEGTGKSSIPGMIDRLSEKTRLGLKEKAADVAANRQAVAEMTTPSMEAYQAYFRGEEHINKLQFDSAAAEFRRAVAVDSTFAVAHYRLAYALGWNGVPGSRRAIEKAMRYVDRVPKREGYLIRGEYAILHQDPGQALALYKELQSLYPDDKEANYLVGDYSYHRMDFTTAEHSLRKVLSLDPTFARAYQHLSWGLMLEKKFDEMGEVARRNIANAPSPSAYWLLAESYLGRGMFDSALWVCREFAPREFGGPDLRALEGTAFLQQHRFDSATAVFTSMVEGHGNSEEGVRAGTFGLVNTSIQTGAYRAALRHQDRLIGYLRGRGSNRYLAVETMARAFLTVRLVGDSAGAREFHSRARQLEEYGDADYYINLMHYLRAAGDFEGAGEVTRAHLMAAIPLSGRQTEALAEYHEGNYGSAIRTLGDIPFLNHQDLYYLAGALAATGQSDSALAVLGRLKRFYGNYWDFEFFRALYEAPGEYLAGTLHERAGRRQEAIRSYTECLSIWNNADTEIPELIDAKRRLAALRSTAGK